MYDLVHIFCVKGTAVKAIFFNLKFLRIFLREYIVLIISIFPSPLQFPLLPIKSMTSSLLLSHLYMCVYVCNPLSPPSIACMYKCVMLTTWDYLTDQGAHP